MKVENEPSSRKFLLSNLVIIRTMTVGLYFFGIRLDFIEEYRFETQRTFFKVSQSYAIYLNSVNRLYICADPFKRILIQ